MADIIKHKRSGDTGEIPTTSELVLGELAVNYYDGRLFIETYNGTTYGIAQFQPMADGDKGDVTVSAKGQTWTIDNDAVTYAKIQNVSATDRLLGRSTAGAGDIEEITCTAAGRAILDDADAAAQRTTLGLGTMSTQDASSVAITGGTINGATVGATTAASGRFTTITGTSTTASTSSSTGALIIAGGAGIASDSHINSVRVGRGAAGNNITVVGVNTGSQLTSAADGCTMVGYQAGFWNSSGDGNTSLGQNTMLNTRTGSWNSGFGINCLYTNQSGSHNSSLGLEGLYNVTHSYNTSVGSTAGYSLTGSGSEHNVVIGYAAARYHSNGSTALTTSASSVYIGSQVRGKDNSDSNSIVIGASAIGDGANTTVIGTTSTTQTKLEGTSTSVGIISGNRVRVVNAKTPSSASDTGTTGDICWDASYLYVCTATNTWRRVAHATW